MAHLTFTLRSIVATLLACLRHLDAQKRHRCSECRRTGHDVRTCPRSRSCARAC